MSEEALHTPSAAHTRHQLGQDTVDLSGRHHQGDVKVVLLQLGVILKARMRKTQIFTHLPQLPWLHRRRLLPTVCASHLPRKTVSSERCSFHGCRRSWQHQRTPSPSESKYRYVAVKSQAHLQWSGSCVQPHYTDSLVKKLQFLNHLFNCNSWCHYKHWICAIS